MRAMPIFHATSRDSRIGKNQTASLFVGLLKIAARRAIIIPNFGHEGLVKVDSKIPILLRLQLAKYSGDTDYSTAQLMRFAGYTDTSSVISIADNEQEDSRSPAGGGNATSVKPTALTTENPGGSLSTKSKEARVISIDENSDMESLTTRAPKEYSLRCGQLPAIPKNPGPEDDHEGETEGSISQEVSLASDTTGMVLQSILIQYLTCFVGFHSINTTEATSNPNLHAVVFNNFGDTQTNDNFGPAQVEDNLIISAEKNLSINQQTSDVVKRTSPKSSKHKTDHPKSTRDERRKRVRTEAFEKYW
jgi:hypothetical protein